LQIDVVVVSYGAVTINANEHGASVILLEKMPEPAGSAWSVQAEMFMEKIPRKKLVSKHVIDGLGGVSTSTLGSVMDRMGIDGIINGLKCLVPGVRIAGSAFTVKESVGTLGTYSRSDFCAGEAIDLMEAGDVLVLSCINKRKNIYAQ
jgi:hypothetical protein